VGFPLTWGLASVAPEAVRVVLGAKWEQAILPLQILAIVMPMRMVSSLLPAATDGIGRPDVGLKSMLFACVLMVPAFAVGCQWGIFGLSIAWLAGYPLVAAQNFYRSAQAIGMPAGAIWLAAARPLAASALMAGAVHALRWTLPSTMPEALSLTLLVLCGAVVYAGASLVLNRNTVSELGELLPENSSLRALVKL